MSQVRQYQNPLNSRYASAEMSYVFSPENKFRTWRKLWIALAGAQKKLGLGITDAQLEEMEASRSLAVLQDDEVHP